MDQIYISKDGRRVHIRYDMNKLTQLREELARVLSEMESDLEEKLRPVLSSDEENDHSPEEDELIDDSEALCEVLEETEYERYRKHVLLVLFSGKMEDLTVE